MEPRRMLDADPIQIGAVFLETDDGADNQPDIFEISFEGGAAGTQLTEVYIDLDQSPGGPAGVLQSPDLFFDTASTGFGHLQSQPFEVVGGDTDGIDSVTAEVVDGTSQLKLTFEGFDAGEKFTFSIDVDHANRVFINDNLDVLNTANPDDLTAAELDYVNRFSFDAIASGSEFATSKFEATFAAPGFAEVNGTGRYTNEYTFDGTTLQLTGDDETNSPDRTDGVRFELQQEELPVTIGGRVFHDRDFNLNQDGVVPEADHGIQGVNLALWKLNEQTDTYENTGHTAITNADGDYLFGEDLGLGSGTYRVVETQPADYDYSVGAVPGTVEGGTTGIVDPFDNNVIEDIVIPLGGQHSINNNFAEAKPVELSGFVYHDRNDNGRRDDGEEGIEGVTIRLLPINTAVLEAPREVQTGADGSYSFTGLAPGEYEVYEIEQPDGYIDGKDTTGRVLNAPVGVAGDEQITEIFLRSEDKGLEYNFGEIKEAKISGNVHLSTADGDCFGSVPGTYTPLEGVRVELIDLDTNEMRFTFTDASGDYSFDGLPPGNYKVVEFTPDHVLDGGSQVGQTAGDADGVKDPADPSNVITAITLEPGAVAVNYDFCEHLPAEIAGNVYHDLDNDGIRDTGEEGIGGVTIILRDAATGGFIADTTTEDDGSYSFSRLTRGDYTIEEVHPTAYTDGKDTAGTVDTATRGVATNDVISNVHLDFGDSGIEYNFGERLLSEISGNVHYSTPGGDCFGDLPPGEEYQPIEGVVVRLVNESTGDFVEKTTDAAGNYSFTDLDPGTYSIVEFTPAGLINGGARVGETLGDADGVLDPLRPGDAITGITLEPGAVAVDYDFCEHKPASISGFVYHDANNDGVFDKINEDAISGVKVILRDGDGNFISEENTEADGSYSFEGLAKGEYLVEEVHPADWIDGKDTVGTVDAVANGFAGNDEILGINLLYGDDGVEYNFGERLLGIIRGNVHISTEDGNCFGDSSTHLPLKDVIVRLINQDTNEVLETTTDAAGDYWFEDLEAGNYTIVEITPDHVLDGAAQVGKIGGVVVGVKDNPSRISNITLAAGDVGDDYDFCEHLPSTISGFVYHDRNDNGAKEDGELGIPQATVILRNAAGEEVGRQLTGDNGEYSFTGLEPGEYTLEEIQPAGYLDGKDTTGQIDTVDVGVAGNDIIQSIVLPTGSDGVNYNFGELLPASIEGFVFSDPDEDCIFHVDEDPIQGVTIILRDAATGAVIDDTVTDEFGHYKFDNLTAGDYTIEEIQPADYFHGGQTVGEVGNGDASVTDFLSSISIQSGDALENYNFCELPAGRISGFVFVDGAPILTDTGAPPADLTGIRDGNLTSDDTRIQGVTLELRNGITGDVINGQDLLAGVYPDGPVVTTTDVNGFYEFTGLPPGSYAVYEIQPVGYFDGIDTPGTASGIAVNPNQPKTAAEQQSIFLLSEDPGDDAIIRIGLGIGGVSEQNNFSEVETSFGPPPPPPPPQLPPPEIPPPTPPTSTPPQTPQVAPSATPPSSVISVAGGTSIQTVRSTGGFEFKPYSWHLSVINAGTPRGNGVELDPTDTFQQAGHVSRDRWQAEDLQGGSFELVTGYTDPTSREFSEQLFGLDGAIPFAGDFNGDGTDEVGVFFNGEWFIDINGNGRWDDEDLWASLGQEGDRPVTGDWDGDGKDDIGIFGPEWKRDPHAIEREPGLPDADNERKMVDLRDELLRRKNMPPQESDATGGHRVMQRTPGGRVRADLIDHVFRYGEHHDTPVAGDWNGDGIRDIGMFRNGVWHLDVDGDGRISYADKRVEFGREGDIPVTGDWNGDGIENIGVYRDGVWYLDVNGNHELEAVDRVFEMGGAGDTPVTGDWDGDGIDEPGIYRNGTGLRQARRDAS